MPEWITQDVVKGGGRLRRPLRKCAGAVLPQLVERNLAKVEVARSSLVSGSVLRQIPPRSPCKAMGAGELHGGDSNHIVFYEACEAEEQYKSHAKAPLREGRPIIILLNQLVMT